MEYLARIATDSEVRAGRVEKAAVKIKMAEYMAEHFNKGDNFTGYISSINEGYIKVLLPNMVCGKVYYSVKDWTISKDGFSLINNRSKEHLLVGDQINLILKNIDLDSGEVIFLKEKCKECSYEEEKKKGKTKIKIR